MKRQVNNDSLISFLQMEMAALQTAGVIKYDESETNFEIYN